MKEPSIKALEIAVTIDDVKNVATLTKRPSPTLDRTSSPAINTFFGTTIFSQSFMHDLRHS